MTNPTKIREFPLWTNLVTLFPLLVWRSAYDSFHEPKWCFLSIGVGLILLIRILRKGPLFRPITPLDLPAWFCLLATLLAWRWDATDRWVSLAFWLRLVLVYFLFRLWVSGFARSHRQEEPESPSFDLALVSILGGGIVLNEWLFSPPTWEAGRVWSLAVAACLLLRWGVQHFLNRGAYPHQTSLHHLLNALLVSGIGVAAMAILEDWGIARWSESPVSDWRFHLSSTLGNPNEVGGFLSYLIPCLLYRFWTSEKPGPRLFWGLAGIVYLYALTTVFTVGAWLGLFVVFPISAYFFARYRPSDSVLGKRAGLVGVLSIGLFLLLQVLLRVPLRNGFRTGVFLVGGLGLLAFSWFLFDRFRNRKRLVATGTVAVLLGVWGFLLLPWGIPNHPAGLIEEAVSSPRWKGGFGARRFIWRTTGLMVRDHPFRGIGWGHYYFVHARYQGILYSMTGKPHDRPTVGLVPQVHSDPLQVLAEAGPLGSISFLWLGLAAFSLGLRGFSRPSRGMEPGMLWAVWTGLGLIAFHSLVDFPFRQPQPVLLAVFFLVSISLSTGRLRENPSSSRLSTLPVFPLALLFIGMGYWGLVDQVSLKRGFGLSVQAERIGVPHLRESTLAEAAERLAAVRYPLPETHDKWIYSARVHLELGDFESAHRDLEMARRYRHSLALYQTWKDLGQRIRSPRVVLDSVLGMIRYNPNWAGFHREAAELWRMVGDPVKAEEERNLARKFRVE